MLFDFARFIYSCPAVEKLPVPPSVLKVITLLPVVYTPSAMAVATKASRVSDVEVVNVTTICVILAVPPDAARFKVKDVPGLAGVNVFSEIASPP
ncbi:MAG: hypothetical protein II540_01565 [Paludibacteraceae bacterium]|nr:hypothetical protein [Paludibacteraceae bacterium]